MLPTGRPTADLSVHSEGVLWRPHDVECSLALALRHGILHFTIASPAAGTHLSTPSQKGHCRSVIGPPALKLNDVTSRLAALFSKRYTLLSFPHTTFIAKLCFIPSWGRTYMANTMTPCDREQKSLFQHLCAGPSADNHELGSIHATPSSQVSLYGNESVQHFQTHYQTISVPGESQASRATRLIPSTSTLVLYKTDRFNISPLVSLAPNLVASHSFRRDKHPGISIVTYINITCRT